MIHVKCGSVRYISDASWFKTVGCEVTSGLQANFCWVVKKLQAMLAVALQVISGQ